MSPGKAFLFVCIVLATHLTCSDSSADIVLATDALSSGNTTVVPGPLSADSVPGDEPVSIRPKMNSAGRPTETGAGSNEISPGIRNACSTSAIDIIHLRAEMEVDSHSREFETGDDEGSFGILSLDLALPIPEPSSIAILGACCLWLGTGRRRTA